MGNGNIKLEHNNQWKPGADANRAVYFSATGGAGYTENAYGAISIKQLTALRDTATALLKEWEESTKEPTVREQVAALPVGTVFQITLRTGKAVYTKTSDVGTLLLLKTNVEGGSPSRAPLTVGESHVAWHYAKDLKIIDRFDGYFI
jgi:hypothetical protein